MSHDDTDHDQTESVGATMIRLNLSEWELAPEFKHLKDAPIGEFEACETISDEAAIMERRARPARASRSFIRATFSNFEEFKKEASANEPLFFLVFEKRPNDTVLKLLAEHADCERVLLLDVAEDRGFLKNTPITVDGTPAREVLSKPLAELRGIGAWARGTFLGFEVNEAAMASFISRVCAFGRPGKKP